MVLGLLPDVIWISSPFMRRRSAADFLLGARSGSRPRSFLLRMDETISPGRDNTITHLCAKLNLMLFSYPPSRLADRFHFLAQRLDEMRGIGRERRATLDRDIGIEARRLLDLQQPVVVYAAVRHRELVD